MVKSNSSITGAVLLADLFPVSGVRPAVLRPDLIPHRRLVPFVLSVAVFLAVQRRAAGRNYLHINANGDIEPCAFIHYSDSNIHDKTLIEAFQSPLFMACRAGQPFSDNLLRPCPLLDNPGALAAMVERSGAHSTDLQSPEDVHDLSEKCREKAERWKPAADRLWTCGHGCPGCKVQ